MDNYVDKLTPIQKGMRISEVLTADRITAWQELLMHLLRGDNIIDTPNVFVTHTQGGVELDTVGSDGGRGGGSVEYCTNLKLSLVKELNGTQEEHHLKVSSGLLDGLPLNHDEVVSGATKVFFVIDGMAAVTSETSSATGDTIYSYTGGAVLSNHRILLTPTDPTDITPIHPTSTASVPMVFAMLAGEVKEELDPEGNTVLKLVEYHCGNKAVKWCPPQSFYFLPI